MSTRPVPVKELKEKFTKLHDLRKKALERDRALVVAGCKKKFKKSIFFFWRRKWDDERIIKYLKNKYTWISPDISVWQHLTLDWSISYDLDRLEDLVNTFDETEVVNVSSRDATQLRNHMHRAASFLSWESLDNDPEK